MPEAPLTDWRVIVGTLIIIIVTRLVDRYLPAKKPSPPSDPADKS